MFIYFRQQEKKLLFRCTARVGVFVLSLSLAFGPSAGYAQVGTGLPGLSIGMAGTGKPAPPLPAPGVMVPLTPAFVPPVVKGVKIFPDNPLRFDFIIDTGDLPAGRQVLGMENDVLKTESEKLIKYFLASLTVPEEDLWVNLSPYEKDRIIPGGFGVTEMGRDLLAQDYILKQLTASLMYPEEELGRKFWDRIYKKAYELYGTTEVPVDTFNKVWIVPEKAVVYENGDTAFVVDAKLKVMLEEDYIAMEHNLVGAAPRGRPNINGQAQGPAPTNGNHPIAADIIRAIILPEIEREVNEGENFASLRQIYHSMILATWVKRKLMNGTDYDVGDAATEGSPKGLRPLLGKIYVDQNKVAGVDVQDKDVTRKIYNQYLEAFKTGVYNYIKEDYDPATNGLIPRKYFSGGVGLNNISSPIIDGFGSMSSPVLRIVKEKSFANKAKTDGKLELVSVFLEPYIGGQNPPSAPSSPVGDEKSPDTGRRSQGEDRGKLVEAMVQTSDPDERARIAQELGLDTRPIKAGLLGAEHVLYDMTVKDIFNPGNTYKKVVYGGGGADISNFLISLNARRGLFVSDAYGDLGLEDLRKVAERFNDKTPVDSVYGRFKSRNGHARTEMVDTKEKMIEALAEELKGMDVKGLQVHSFHGHPGFRFRWTYINQKEEVHEIAFIKADITKIETYPNFLKEEIEGGIDGYYQRAGYRIPQSYKDGTFIRYLYAHMNEGAFFVTDDYYYDYFDPDLETQIFNDAARDFPDLNMRSIHVSVPPGITAKLLNTALRMPRDYYGWHMRVRQKTGKEKTGAAPVSKGDAAGPPAEGGQAPSSPVETKEDLVRIAVYLGWMAEQAINKLSVIDTLMQLIDERPRMREETNKLLAPLREVLSLYGTVGPAWSRMKGHPKTGVKSDLEMLSNFAERLKDNDIEQIEKTIGMMEGRFVEVKSALDDLEREVIPKIDKSQNEGDQEKLATIKE